MAQLLKMSGKIGKASVEKSARFLAIFYLVAVV